MLTIAFWVKAYYKAGDASKFWRHLPTSLFLDGILALALYSFFITLFEIIKK
jgi:hypothetical protein